MKWRIAVWVIFIDCTNVLAQFPFIIPKPANAMLQQDNFEPSKSIKVILSKTDPELKQIVDLFLLRTKAQSARFDLLRINYAKYSLGR